MKAYTVKEQGDKVLVKDGRKIVGFAWETQKDGWAYAFGSPASSGGMFTGIAPLDKETAIERIRSAYK